LVRFESVESLLAVVFSIGCLIRVPDNLYAEMGAFFAWR